jgi:predicted amino acid dehydrogenase
MPAHFGFVVHALSPLHRAAIGVRGSNLRMALWRDDGVEPDGISSLCTLKLGDITGEVIAIPLTPEQLLSDQQRALVRMVQAIEQLEPVDAVGLGSLCAVVAGRGEAVAEWVTPPVTTGGAATAWALSENARAVIATQPPGPVALIGARSPVGQAVARILASDGVSLRLDSARAARGIDGARGFKTPEAAAEGCPIIVGAGPTGGTLAAAAVQPGTIVVDVAIPATIRGRLPAGVRVLSGEAMKTPPGWQAGGWGRAYHLLAGYGLSQVYACLAEPLVMASLKRREPLALGRKVALPDVRLFGEEATRLGFAPILLAEHGWKRWL